MEKNLMYYLLGLPKRLLLAVILIGLCIGFNNTNRHEVLQAVHLEKPPEDHSLHHRIIQQVQDTKTALSQFGHNAKVYFDDHITSTSTPHTAPMVNSLHQWLTIIHDHRVAVLCIIGLLVLLPEIFNVFLFILILCISVTL